MTDPLPLDTLWELLQSPPSQLPNRIAVLAMQTLARRIDQLEVQMSQTSDAIAELNAETNSLAGRIDAILASQTSLDTGTATELRAVSTRLRGLAADPANPVPAPAP